MLQGEQKTALTQPNALSGLGGIGKTQLALEYAYRHRQDYHAVLWGRADTHEALISTFVNIAHLLDLPERDEQDQMVTVEAVKTWLGNRSQWLFILDNADELALVKEFLPPAFRGHLLLTTRAQTMGKVVRSKHEVEVMRPEIGALLLLRRARMVPTEASLEEAPDGEVTRAEELAEELGGLPLALDQAGAYIEETQCGLAGYQRLYQTRRAELLRSRGGVVEDHPESVATTWSLSFEQVEQRNPAGADLLRLCAFLAPDAIPEELLSTGARELGDILAPVASDAYQLNQAITALRAYSLISRDPQAQTLTVHRLVQAVLRDSMASAVQQQWMQRVVHAVAAAYPSPDFANWPRYERLLPHALACAIWIKQAPLVTPTAALLLNQAGYYLLERGRYGEAEPLFQWALLIYEQQLGASHPDTATSLGNLAELYRAQGKYAEAEPLYQRALVICEQELGASHPNTATSLNNLAALYHDQGKYEEAVPLYQRALAICEQQLGREHPTTQTVRENYTFLLRNKGRDAEAKQLEEDEPEGANADYRQANAIVHLRGAAELEAFITKKGDDPALDDAVRRRVVEAQVLVLCEPAQGAPDTAHLLHCTVPVGDTTIAMLPVFTRVEHVATAVQMNPSWQSLQIWAMDGSVVLGDLEEGEWLGINPWSGREFKLPATPLTNVPPAH